MIGIDLFVGWINGFYLIPTYIFLREFKSITFVWGKTVIGIMLVYETD